MKWEPMLDEEEEREVKTGWISDNTAFARMQTQLEKDDAVVDDAFLRKHASRYLAFNKFAPLSKSDKQQKQIERIRSIKSDLLEHAGLHDDSMRVALDSIRDHQNLRGQDGFYQKAMITQRHEIKEDEKEAKLGRFSGLWKKKPPEAEGE